MGTSTAYKNPRELADQVIKKIKAMNCPLMVFVDPKTKECSFSKITPSLSMPYKDKKKVFLGCYDSHATHEWIMDDFSVTIKN